MPVSEARIEANRRNAAKSTGPRTPEGKERSRGNALKHGFRSTVVVHPDDARAMPAGAGEAGPAVATPEGRGLGEWMKGQVALATLKVERCQAMERAVRSRVVLRASMTWDDDRRLEAIRLGAKLAARPEETLAALRETFHGCEWLISRWAMLAHAADSHQGRWTPEQSRLAFDLMGTPPEFREGHPPGTWIDFSGQLVGPTPAPAVVARLAIDALNERREALQPIDEAARERAEADLTDDDPELRRLRRYEAELHRRMKWALGLISVPGSPDADEAPPPRPPGEEAGPAPVPVPPPPPAPSFGPTPAPSRAERRLLKAESRREAKRRKLDQSRA